MSQELSNILESIDELIDSYDSGGIDPDRVIGEIFAERAAQRPLLEEAVAIASDALRQYPLHPELMRRRALARRSRDSSEYERSGSKIERQPSPCRCSAPIRRLEV